MNSRFNRHVVSAELLPSFGAGSFTFMKPRMRTNSRTLRGLLRLITSKYLLVNLGLTGLFALSISGANCTSPSNPIVAENCLAGSPSSEWQISNSGDPSIQGFATDLSVNAGQTIHFKINTPAASYKIEVYRLGYYRGLGARRVTSLQVSAALPQSQPPCLTENSTGLLDCGNWAVSASWDVPKSAVSGIYFLHLTRSDTGGDSHVVFLVRNDSSKSDIVFQTSDETWQAYNDYGGHSLYGPLGVFDLSNRAFKVSYNRPFNTRSFQATSWVFFAEYPMLRWLEANGYNVAYLTSIDVARSGALLKNHHIYLSVGHDEYWSGPKRDSVESARDAGVSLAFLSGNEGFWRTRLESSIDGTNTPYRTLVCYKETLAGASTGANNPQAWTGTWRDSRSGRPGAGGRPENSLTGTLFMVNGPGDDNMNLAIKVPAADGQLRFWRNTSLATQLPGAAANLPISTLGYEWDVDADNGARPSGLFHLSSSTYTLSSDYLLDAGGVYGAGVATHSLTMYRAPSGALVFGAGTVQWSWGLDSTHDASSFHSPDPDVRMQQATVNLFADMGVRPATLQKDLVGEIASADVTPPTSVIALPVAGSVVRSGSQVVLSGSARDSGGRVAGVEVSTDGGQTWHPASGRESWTYTWEPKQVGPATLVARAVDDSGNLESLHTGTAVSVTPRKCPCSEISATAYPAEVDGGDSKPIEVGVKFRTESSGFITGLRFYKSAANTGMHVGNIWTASGKRLGTAVFTAETPSGWQQASFQVPIAITANTNYIASYFAPAGHYSATLGAFMYESGNRPLLFLADGSSGGNGVFTYSSVSEFLTQNYGATNYWVDVVFIPAGVTPGEGKQPN